MPESSQPACVPAPPEIELLKLIVDYLPYANEATTAELLSSVRLILADGPGAGADTTVSTGTQIEAEDRCPDCGSLPDDPDVHRPECPRVDTCAQMGPPWIDRPWHQYDVEDWTVVKHRQHMQEVHGG